MSAMGRCSCGGALNMAEGGSVDDDDLSKPSFRKPLIAKRREDRQDRKGSADAPISVARGLVAGSLGLPGDIEQLARAAWNVKSPRAGKTINLPNIDELPFLRTSEDFNATLPLRAAESKGRGAWEGLGNTLAPGPLSVAVKGAGKVAPALEKIADRISAPAEPLIAGRRGAAAAQTGAIKLPGGNWVGGENERLGSELRGWEPEPIPGSGVSTPVPDWMEKRVSNYVRKQMGTADDPLLALEREGRLHITPEEIRPGSTRADTLELLDPGGALHKQLTGRTERTPWESIADMAIQPKSAQVALRNEMGRGAVPDWLMRMGKQDPGAQVYGVNDYGLDRLGFGHIRDYLDQATIAGTQRLGGMPDEDALKMINAGLDIDPTKLERMSFPDVVRKTADWNDASKKWQDEANALLDMNKGIKSVLKQYPDTGHQWVEVDSAGLANEGKVMGHCVGGYCPSVESGEKRILSLRDKNMQPHVTVELAKPQGRVAEFNDLDETFRNTIDQRVAEMTAKFDAGIMDQNFDSKVRDRILATFRRDLINAQLKEQFPDFRLPVPEDAPWDIRQIKGKSNKAPIADYQPAVRDLVRNMGPWGDVRELENAGLNRAHGRYWREGELEEATRKYGRVFDEENGPALSFEDYLTNNPYKTHDESFMDFMNRMQTHSDSKLELPEDFTYEDDVRKNFAIGGSVGVGTNGPQAVGLGTFGGANQQQGAAPVATGGGQGGIGGIGNPGWTVAPPAPPPAPAPGQPQQMSPQDALKAQGVTAPYGTPEYWQQYDKAQQTFDGLGGLFTMGGMDTNQFKDPNRYMGMNAYWGDSNLYDPTRQALMDAHPLFGMGLEDSKKQMMSQYGWDENQYNNAMRNMNLYGNDFLGTALRGKLPTDTLTDNNGNPLPPSLAMNTPEGQNQLANWLQTAGAGARLDGLQAFTGSYGSPFNPGTAGGDSDPTGPSANFRPLIQAAAQTGFDISKYDLDPKQVMDMNKMGNKDYMGTQKFYNDLNDYLKDYHTVHTLSSNYGDLSRGERGNANILYKDDGQGNWQPVYVGKQATEREKGNYFQENPDLVGVLSVLLMGVGGVGGLANLAGAGLTGGTLAAANIAGGVAMGVATGGEKGALMGALGGAGGYVGGAAGGAAGNYFGGAAGQQIGQQVGGYFGTQAGKQVAKQVKNGGRIGPAVSLKDIMADELANIEEDDVPDYEVVENPDGSADVLDPVEDDPRTPEFSENLAEVFEESYLLQLGTELMEIIKRDVEDRKKRDKQYEDGIRRTGLGKDAPGGADFEGASTAVHPMLAKGSVDFASRAVKELMPATGPCKTMIVGEQTQEKVDKAERKRKYMNWQCTTQIEEYRAELERVLSQVPLGGAQYKRWWWDDELRRPRTEAVFIDDVFMPYGSSDFYTAPRIAYRQLITQQEYERRVRNGLYVDSEKADHPNSLVTADLSKSRAASDKVEGVDDSNALVYNEDGLRLMWQVEILYDEENDELTERPAPYIMHIDDSSMMVIGYFRNWRENDDRMRKKGWMTEWPFIPWRGGPVIGLAHLIGTLAGASTGALRAILDSAHISTFPGAVKPAGGRSAGESIQVSPTEIKEIDAPAGVDDIRKLIMPFPFPGPSTVLFQIMEWLTQQAEMVVATASEKIADAGNNMPVGTALALIEQGSTNFSAVHARLHNSMKRDLEILHRLNAENMADQETVEDLGELMVGREDFQGPMDIIPVSDPNIFSETQRYAQLQAVMQLKADPAFAQYFKQDALLARALKLLNVPDVDGIANLPKETKRMSPLEENYSLGMQERPLKVYPEQDDLVHLKSHIQFATSPMFGANPLMASGVMAPMLQHCKEHIMALYKKHTRAATDQFKVEAKARGIPLEDDQAELYGAAFTEQLLSQLLGETIMPGLQQMQKTVSEIAQSSAPKPDPNIVTQVEGQKAIEQLKIASNEKIKTGELQWKQQLEAMDTRQQEADRQSQERLAQLSTSVELILQKQEAGAQQALAEFQATHDTQITVLKSVLDAALASMQQTQQDTAQNAKKTNVIMPGGTNLASDLLEPLMGQLSQTLQEGIMGINAESSPMYAAVQGLAQQQQAFAQGLQEQRESMTKTFAIVAQALTHLNNQTGQQYEAELYVDPKTGQKRARRVPVQPQSPQGGPPPGGAQAALPPGMAAAGASGGPPNQPPPSAGGPPV